MRILGKLGRNKGDLDSPGFQFASLLRFAPLGQRNLWKGSNIMGRKNRRGWDQFGSQDTDDSTAVEQTSPSGQQPPAKQPSPKRAATPKPAGGFTPLDPFPAATQMIGADGSARSPGPLSRWGFSSARSADLLNFPLWPDEAYLAHNYLDRSYLALLQPLDYGQVVPLLYLWVQKTIILIFGFSEYSLRLYVFLGSIASLFLFRHLAGRLLQGTARLMAIGTFAVAYPLIRYSAEAEALRLRHACDLAAARPAGRVAREPSTNPLALDAGLGHARGRVAFLSGCVCGACHQPGNAHRTLPQWHGAAVAGLVRTESARGGRGGLVVFCFRPRPD